MAAGLTTDQWKKTIGDYAISACGLTASMQKRGFDESQPIPVDADYELLGGAHRVACAIALGIEYVPILRYPDKKVWAPEWGLQWFIDHDVEKPVLRRILLDMLEIL